MALPTPHLEKFNAAISNAKLPSADIPRLHEAVRKYHEWIAQLRAVSGGPEAALEQMVALLTKYKFYVDTALIFDSPDDFLYRQKGQLKLDNSIIEEFLPWLLRRELLPGISDDLEVGPCRCYSALYFQSSLLKPGLGGDPAVRAKDQDFAIGRRIYIRTSFAPDFRASSSQETSIAYVAAEIKTNLDKTMFQEACATAHDVKSGVAGAKYFLLCEWLDMTPLGTAGTDIDEVLVLRGAKRLAANVREHFSTFSGRQRHRADYMGYLQEHPFRTDVFRRLLDHVRRLLNEDEPIEEDTLRRGYF
jgi:hypothetical protein